MKLRWKIALGLGIAAAVGLIWFAMIQSRSVSELDAYRKELIARGEKLSRADLVPVRSTNENGAPAFYAAFSSMAMMETTIYPEVIAPGVARVIWRETELVGQYHLDEANYWPAIRSEVLAGEQARHQMIEALGKPAFYSEIDFATPERLSRMFSPHLIAMKMGSAFLTMSGILNLHDGNPARAMEDAVAAVLLPARLESEPFMIGHLVTYACVAIAVHVAWEVLQSDSWNDSQLEGLQRAWERLDLLNRLDTAVTTERILMLDLIQEIREDTDYPSTDVWGAKRGGMSEFIEIGREIFSEPVATLKALSVRYPELWMWKTHWANEEELAFLRHLQATVEGVRSGQQNRSFDFIAGVAATERAWAMKAGDPRYLLRANLSIFEGFFERAQKAQITRELAVAAIALERFRLAHGRYPSDLAELQPRFLNEAPRDFFSDQPLRYRLEEDGRFILYSIGEDGIDDGGQGAEQGNWLSGPDWVWPRAATADEAAEYRARLIRLTEMDSMGSTWGPHGP